MGFLKCICFGFECRLRKRKRSNLFPSSIDTLNNRQHSSNKLVILFYTLTFFLFGKTESTSVGCSRSNHHHHLDQLAADRVNAELSEINSHFHTMNYILYISIPIQKKKRSRNERFNICAFNLK